MGSNLSRNLRGLRPMHLSVVAYRDRSGPANGVLISQKSLTPVLVVRPKARWRDTLGRNVGRFHAGKQGRPAPGHRGAAVGQQPNPWFRRFRAERVVLPMRSAGACRLQASSRSARCPTKLAQRLSGCPLAKESPAIGPAQSGFQVFPA